MAVTEDRRFTKEQVYTLLEGDNGMYKVERQDLFP